MEGKGSADSPFQGSSGFPFKSSKFDISSIYKNIRQKLEETGKTESSDSTIASGQSSDNTVISALSGNSALISGQSNNTVVSGLGSNNTVVSKQSGDNTIVSVRCGDNAQERVSETAEKVVITGQPTGDGDFLAQKSCYEQMQDKNATQIQMESSSMDMSDAVKMETESSNMDTSARTQTERTVNILEQAGCENKIETIQTQTDKTEKHDGASTSKPQKSSDSLPDAIVIKDEVVDLSYEWCSQGGITGAVSHGNNYRLRHDDSDSDTSDMSPFSDVESDEGDLKKPKSTAVKKPLRTLGEVFPEELPPIKDLHISLPEDTKLELLGTVTGIVGVLVVIESKADLKKYSPLNDDSVLFYEDKTIFGEVFEIFGQVSAPSYTVRFNSPEDIENKGISEGLKLYFVPEPVSDLKGITRYVFMKPLLDQKGSDASWKKDHEPPSEVIEYSDDEEEKRVKAKRRANRMAQAGRDAKEAATDSDTVEERGGADSETKNSHQDLDTNKQDRKTRRIEQANIRRAKKRALRAEARKLVDAKGPVQDVPESSVQFQPQSEQENGHLSSPVFIRRSLLGDAPGHPRFDFKGGPFSDSSHRMSPRRGGFLGRGSYRPSYDNQWGSHHADDQDSFCSDDSSQQMNYGAGGSFRPPSDNQWGSHLADDQGSFSSDGSSQQMNYGAGDAFRPPPDSHWGSQYTGNQGFNRHFNFGPFRPPPPRPFQGHQQHARFQGRPQFHRYH